MCQLPLHWKLCPWTALGSRRRFAVLQGHLEAQEAAQAALRSQGDRLTELLQAERRTFADRLAAELAAAEAQRQDMRSELQRQRVRPAFPTWRHWNDRVIYGSYK